jgi:hypothetical protein
VTAVSAPGGVGERSMDVQERLPVENRDVAGAGYDLEVLVDVEVLVALLLLVVIAEGSPANRSQEREGGGPDAVLADVAGDGAVEIVAAGEAEEVDRSRVEPESDHT